MDYTFAELLTREELVKILTERQLNLPDMHQMSHCDLMRVYRSFALPLGRRELHRSTRNRLAFDDTDNRIKKATIHIDNGGMCSMDVDEHEHLKITNKTSPTTNNTMQNEKPINCEKRSREYKQLNPLTDEYLSIATKRIKIAWS